MAEIEETAEVEEPAEAEPEAAEETIIAETAEEFAEEAVESAEEEILAGLTEEAEAPEETVAEIEETAEVEEPVEVEPEVPEQAEEEITGEVEEGGEDTFDADLPGYSEMMDSSESIGLDSLGKDQEDTDVLELDENEALDMSKLTYDLSAEEDVEPVMTEEERAELSGLEDSTQTSETDSDIDFELGSATEEESTDLSGIEEGMETKEEAGDSEKTAPGDLYSDLSYEEIEGLSVTDTEPDESDNTLESETREGIDYSDVLYGQESIEMVETEAAGGFVTAEEKQPEEKSIEEAGPEEISHYEDETGSIKDVISETEVIAADESVTEAEEQAPSISGESVEIIEEMIKSTPVYEITEEVEEEIADVDKSSLDELIVDYVEVLKKSGEEEKKQPEGDDSPESITGDDEIEMDLTGDKPLEEIGDAEASDIEDATATMAEIFVSQGLISRAVEIYKILIKKEPDNEELKSRLEELEQMIDDE